MTILLTRPRAASESLASRLAPLPCLIAPVMEIVPIDAPLPDEYVRGLVFTSAAGVRAYAARAADRSRIAYCVGPRTAEAAQAEGFKTLAAGGTLQDLDAMLTEKDVDRTGLCHLGGTHRAGTLSGIPHIALYDQKALPPDQTALAALASGAISLAPLYSPRSAAILADWIGPSPSRLPHFIAISQAATDALPWAKARITTISQPDGALMEQMIRKHNET